MKSVYKIIIALTIIGITALIIYFTKNKNFNFGFGFTNI